MYPLLVTIPPKWLLPLFSVLLPNPVIGLVVPTCWYMGRLCNRDPGPHRPCLGRLARLYTNRIATAMAATNISAISKLLDQVLLVVLEPLHTKPHGGMNTDDISRKPDNR